MKLTFFMFIMLNIFSSSTKKPLLMSCSLLLMSFFMMVFLLNNFVFWYGMIFFLMYVGAVLVLVFYVVCVNSNPIKFMMNWLLILLGLFTCFMFYKLKMMKYYMNLNMKKYSLSFFDLYENYMMIFLFTLLLMMLWLISKFTFLSVSSIRTFV